MYDNTVISSGKDLVVRVGAEQQNRSFSRY